MLRFIFLAAVGALFAGCASHRVKDRLDPARANTRAMEQARMNEIERGEVNSMRGAEVLVIDPTKTFNPSVMRSAGGRELGMPTARTGEFHFEDRVRTKSFAARGFATKEAWMNGATYETKEAPVKTSWFARLTAPTKSYATKETTEGQKTVAVRALPEGDRAFIGKGRRQADYDAKGPKAQAFGSVDGGQSYAGDLREIKTIEDIRSLLNKN